VLLTLPQLCTVFLYLVDLKSFGDFDNADYLASALIQKINYVNSYAENLTLFCSALNVRGLSSLIPPYK
jgi:hypothetical protein